MQGCFLNPHPGFPELPGAVCPPRCWPWEQLRFQGPGNIPLLILFPLRGPCITRPAVFPWIAALCLSGSPGADEVLMGTRIGIDTQGPTAASRFLSQLGKPVGKPPAPSLKGQGVEWKFGMQGCLRGQGWCLWIGNVVLLGGLLSWKWKGKRGGSESCVLQ